MKSPSDLHVLAREALDLWQEHLTALANDPKAKLELAQVMEPSRRMFAEWMEKAQNGTYGSSSTTPHGNTDATVPAPNGAASAGDASDDGAVRLAQLTLHVAELERRVAKLEARKPAATRKSATAKTANASERNG